MSAARYLAGAAGSLAATLAGTRRLLVLTYHRVLPEPDSLLPGEPCRRVFAEHMAVLRRHFSPVPLEQALDQLHAGGLPSRAVAVTFDDGYTDNLLHALPILQEYRIPATCFVATDYMSGGCMFNDRVIDVLRRVQAHELDLGWLGLGTVACESTSQRSTAIERVLGALKYQSPAQRIESAESIAAIARIAPPQDLMMSAAQVQALAAGGVAVGAHTCSHPILSRISESEARREIASSRQTLHSLLGGEIRLFAYPNGRRGQDFTDRDVAEVRLAGFAYALTTDWACATPEHDPLLVPRISVAGYRGDALALRLGKYFFE
jgi:peptidoglycan/xylan/chitin deacetylase (PgdA/CDA1 family)